MAAHLSLGFFGSEFSQEGDGASEDVHQLESQPQTPEASETATVLVSALIEFRQSGPCLIAWQGPTPVAQIAWDAADSGWYINFLSVEQPQLLAPLLAKFRKLWRQSGKPTLSFHASPENQVIGRLIEILGAQCFAGLYTIVDLDHSTRSNHHG